MTDAKRTADKYINRDGSPVGRSSVPFVIPIRAGYMRCKRCGVEEPINPRVPADPAPTICIACSPIERKESAERINTNLLPMLDNLLPSIEDEYQQLKLAANEGRISWDNVHDLGKRIDALKASRDLMRSMVDRELDERF